MIKLLFLLVLLQIALAQRLMGSLLRKDIPQENSWKTIFVKQRIDHFAFDQASNERHFSQKILVNLDHWKPGGSLFFYTGNEGAIELFAQNTGFVFDIAPAFDAAVVFAEHRYYGVSMPYGSLNESFSDWTKSRYLTVEQAMADFADNIIWLKESYLNKTDTPVITFGGSYGGMLAAWMRAKYPSLVQGAIAASAPVWMFPGMGMWKDLTGPYRIITQVFHDAQPDCPAKVTQSWDVITEMGKTTAGLKQLTNLFRTCKPLDRDGVISLSNWLNGMYFDMAMVNYPYPTSFLADLPAWPVKEFCRRTNASEDVVTAIAAGAQMYSNYTGKLECLDLDSDPAGDLGMTGWDYQACMEMILPISSDKTVDMFPDEKFDLESYISSCEQQWNTTARPFWLKYYFGGLDGFDFSGYSNIFFSNGRLDPWAAGGTVIIEEKFCLADCPNILIEDGAHHLDLRSSNPADPESVLMARKQEVDAIKRWTSRPGTRFEL